MTRCTTGRLTRSTIEVADVNAAQVFFFKYQLTSRGRVEQNPTREKIGAGENLHPHPPMADPRGLEVEDLCEWVVMCANVRATCSVRSWRCVPQKQTARWLTACAIDTTSVPYQAWATCSESGLRTGVAECVVVAARVTG